MGGAVLVPFGPVEFGSPASAARRAGAMPKEDAPMTVATDVIDVKPAQQRVSENVRKCPNAAGDLNQTAPAPESLLSDKQHAAIELLLMGKSPGVTARAVGVDPRTLYRWRHDPDFRD